MILILILARCIVNGVHGRLIELVRILNLEFQHCCSSSDRQLSKQNWHCQIRSMIASDPHGKNKQYSTLQPSSAFPRDIKAGHNALEKFSYSLQTIFGHLFSRVSSLNHYVCLLSPGKVPRICEICFSSIRITLRNRNGCQAIAISCRKQENISQDDATSPGADTPVYNSGRLNFVLSFATFYLIKKIC